MSLDRKKIHARVFGRNPTPPVAALGGGDRLATRVPRAGPLAAQRPHANRHVVELKWTRQRCQVALSTLAKLAVRPFRASGITSLTPLSPRRAGASLPGALSAAIALGQTLGALILRAGAGQTADLPFHQAPRRKADHLVWRPPAKPLYWESAGGCLRCRGTTPRSGTRPFPTRAGRRGGRFRHPASGEAPSASGRRWPPPRHGRLVPCRAPRHATPLRLRAARRVPPMLVKR